MDIDSYRIEEMTKDKFMPLFNKYRPIVFDSNHDYRLNSVLGDSEEAKIRQLEKIWATHTVFFWASLIRMTILLAGRWGFKNAEEFTS